MRKLYTISIYLLNIAFATGEGYKPCSYITDSQGRRSDLKSYVVRNYDTYTSAEIPDKQEKIHRYSMDEERSEVTSETHREGEISIPIETEYSRFLEGAITVPEGLRPRRDSLETLTNCLRILRSGSVLLSTARNRSPKKIKEQIIGNNIIDQLVVGTQGSSFLSPVVVTPFSPSKKKIGLTLTSPKKEKNNRAPYSEETLERNNMLEGLCNQVNCSIVGEAQSWNFEK